MGLVPNLQSPELAQQAGVAPDPDNPLHHVNDLHTFFLTWAQASTVWTPPEALAETSVVALLYGFFRVYTQDLPSDVLVASIRCGKDSCLPKTCFRKTSSFLCIEDPFETWDSHCPHDLAAPTVSQDAERLRACLQSAEAQLGALLVEHDECCNEPVWPAARPKPNGKPNKGQKGPATKAKSGGDAGTKRAKAEKANGATPGKAIGATAGDPAKPSQAKTKPQKKQSKGTGKNGGSDTNEPSGGATEPTEHTQDERPNGATAATEDKAVPEPAHGKKKGKKEPKRPPNENRKPENSIGATEEATVSKDATTDGDGKENGGRGPQPTNKGPEHGPKSMSRETKQGTAETATAATEDKTVNATTNNPAEEEETEAIPQREFERCDGRGDCLERCGYRW